MQTIEHFVCTQTVSDSLFRERMKRTHSPDPWPQTARLRAVSLSSSSRVSVL